jgi:hypothetical protein
MSAIAGTYFWEVLGDGAGSGRAAHAPGGHQEMGVPMRTQGGELFIDRDAKVGRVWGLFYVRCVSMLGDVGNGTQVGLAVRQQLFPDRKVPGVLVAPQTWLRYSPSLLLDCSVTSQSTKLWLAYAACSLTLQMFKYILEYLRAVCNNEHFSPLPHDAT